MYQYLKNENMCCNPKKKTTHDEDATHTANNASGIWKIGWG